MKIMRKLVVDYEELLSNILERFYWLILYIVIGLSDLGKLAEETQDIELHQAVPRSRVCDDYTTQPTAVADDDHHSMCTNVKFPLTPSCITFMNTKYNKAD